jgi:isopentenyl-diphosphate delta-isomerase
MSFQDDPNINNRKLDHLNIVIGKDTEPYASSFDMFQLPYLALPELDLKKIDTSITFMGRKLNFPFIISSMTGGPDKGMTINRNLAEAAEQAKVGLGLGSMRVIIRKPEAKASFDVRKYCPSIPLFANMGLVQLNYGYGADEINRIIDAIDADGIFLHVNPLQEAIQPEGNTDFSNLLSKLEIVVKKVRKPIIVKEVGTGIDPVTAKRLREVGIEWIDVSGTGGTSWAWVEGYRRKDDLGHIFREEGVPTADCLMAARKIKGLNLIAGGGVRNGIHIAKSLALGAKLATAAKPLLKPALESTESALEVLNKLEKELRIAMFCSGAANLKQMAKIKLLY